jgi:hypothetical protein
VKLRLILENGQVTAWFFDNTTMEINEKTKDPGPTIPGKYRVIGDAMDRPNLSRRHNKGAPNFKHILVTTLVKFLCPLAN